MLNGPAAFLQALTILKADDRELAEAEQLFGAVFRQLDPLHETGRVRWQDLLGFVMGWAHHRRPLAERPHWHSLALQMQQTAERQREIENMGLTIAQGLIQEGRQEGLREGELQHARRTLLRLGSRRFGEPDAAVRHQIEHIADLDQLDRLTDQVGQAATWPELLAVR